ncbi:MAG TPA: glycosyltransferase family 39 protein, partial [Candidatus Polarisedimenticolia bacterium]|nr:glycosyltransferase family 39 protein [Candidatus Polarisedimenticolia bacterium]
MTSPPQARPGSGRAWAAGLACAGVGLVLRLSHLAALRALPTFDGYIMDEAYHDTWARAIASGDWLGTEVFFRAPLYPYFLGAVYAVAGTGGLAPRLIQCLLGSLSVLLVHRIGLRIGSRGSAAAAALLTALCGPLIHFDNELLITVLEGHLLLAALLLLLKGVQKEAGGAGRARIFLAAGAVLGLAAIARPNMLAAAPAALAAA